MFLCIYYRYALIATIEYYQHYEEYSVISHSFLVTK